MGLIENVRGLDAAAPAMVGLGAVAVFIGVSVLGPVLARPVSRVLGAPLAHLRGMAGMLARENAVRNPKRTARTAASLMIGVALVSFIAIFAASAKSSLSSSVKEDYHGTHIVDSGAFDGSFGISPRLAETLRHTAGVSTVSEHRIASVEIDGESESYFSGYDTTTIATAFDLGHVEGDLASLGFDGIAVFVDEDDKDAPALGDTMMVTFPSGTKPFVVRATFDNSDEWVGSKFVSVAAFDANVPSPLDARVYVIADSASTIEQVADAYPIAEVLDKQGFVDSKNESIDMMLKLIYALLGLAVVIALLGITNTLALSIHERRREIGLLRAVGMSRSQVRSAVRYESVIIALFGTLLGLGVGFFFGWAMVGALKDQGISTFAGAHRRPDRGDRGRCVCRRSRGDLALTAGRERGRVEGGCLQLTLVQGRGQSGPRWLLQSPRKEPSCPLHSASAIVRSSSPAEGRPEQSPPYCSHARGHT